MYIVAVTGGIGSGKSTVVELFRHKGVPVVDTDIIARQVIELPATRDTIVNTFGPQALTDDQKINRAWLRQVIFDDETRSLQLESILQPLIHQAVLKELSQIQSDYCLLVIPLLYESKHDYPHDRFLLVEANREQQIQRTMQRDNTSRASVEKILSVQANPELRRQIADDIIDNSGPTEALQTQVESLHKHYLALSKQSQNA